LPLNENDDVNDSKLHGKKSTEILCTCELELGNASLLEGDCQAEHVVRIGLSDDGHKFSLLDSISAAVEVAAHGLTVTPFCLPPRWRYTVLTVIDTRTVSDALCTAC